MISALLEITQRFHQVKTRAVSLVPAWSSYRLRLNGYGIVIVNIQGDSIVFPFGDRSHALMEMLNFLNGYEQAIDDIDKIVN